MHLVVGKLRIRFTGNLGCKQWVVLPVIAIYVLVMSPSWPTHDAHSAIKSGDTLPLPVIPALYVMLVCDGDGSDISVLFHLTNRHVLNMINLHLAYCPIHGKNNGCQFIDAFSNFFLLPSTFRSNDLLIHNFIWESTIFYMDRLNSLSKTKGNSSKFNIVEYHRTYAVVVVGICVDNFDSSCRYISS